MLNRRTKSTVASFCLLLQLLLLPYMANGSVLCFDGDGQVALEIPHGETHCVRTDVAFPEHELSSNSEHCTDTSLEPCIQSFKDSNTLAFQPVVSLYLLPSSFSNITVRSKSVSNMRVALKPAAPFLRQSVVLQV